MVIFSPWIFTPRQLLTSEVDWHIQIHRIRFGRSCQWHPWKNRIREWWSRWKSWSGYECQKILKSLVQKTRQMKWINFTDFFWIFSIKVIEKENIQKSFVKLIYSYLISRVFFFFGLDFLKFPGSPLWFCELIGNCILVLTCKIWCSWVKLWSLRELERGQQQKATEGIALSDCRLLC